MTNPNRVILNPRSVCALLLATAGIAHADLRDTPTIAVRASAVAPATGGGRSTHVRCGAPPLKRWGARPVRSFESPTAEAMGHPVCVCKRYVFRRREEWGTRRSSIIDRSSPPPLKRWATRLFTTGFSDPEAVPAASRKGRAGGTGPGVRELPAAPGSASLFLSALLSVGAWHLVRSARQFGGNLPAWYHGDHPRQIGVTVPFVPDERAPAIYGPIAAALLGTAVLRLRCEQCLWYHKWTLQAIAIPRGPPSSVLSSRA